MYQFSDSESSDSEDGIRYKTDSTRNKVKQPKSSSSSSRYNSKHSRKRKDSPEYSRRRRKSRSRSRERHRNRRPRSTSPIIKRSETKERQAGSTDRRLESERRFDNERKFEERRLDNERKVDSERKLEYERRLDIEKKSEIERPSDKRTDYNEKRSEFSKSESSDPSRKVDGSERSNKSKLKRDRSRSHSKTRTKSSKLEDNTSREHKRHRHKDRKHQRSKKEDLKCDRNGDFESVQVVETVSGHSSPCKRNFPSVEKPDDHSGNAFIDVENKSDGDTESTIAALGPALPPHLISKQTDATLGPALPPHMMKSKVADASTVDQNSKEDVIGPALPPHLLNSGHRDNTVDNSSSRGDSSNNVNINPENSEVHELKIKGDKSNSLEDNKEKEEENSEDKISDITEKSRIGPELPAHLRERLAESGIGNELIPSASSLGGEINSEEEDTYGPLPVEMAVKSGAHLALEERALQMKLDRLNPTDNKASREEWMMELPEVRAPSLGFGPRQFKKNAGPDMSDRSSWTDTPEQKSQKKEEKVDLRKEAELMAVKKHDEEQEAMIKKHKKKKKDKSLLEQHQDKLNKERKKQKDSGQTERRPFSRDIDLKVNKFDEAQKKAILKKAQLLDDRFSTGQSKFL